jgi:hypothetical protein
MTDDWGRDTEALLDSPTQGAVLDPVRTLNVLLATGMAPWDAMVFLLEQGVPRHVFPALAGVPDAALELFLGPAAATRAFGRIVQGTYEWPQDRWLADLDGARAALLAYLAARKVDGDLNLYGQDWVKELPAGLHVTGTLSLDGLPIRVLPPGLEVGRNLFLANSDVVTLPDGLRVGGSLTLTKTPIATLPVGLTVGEHLLLDGALRLRRLPERLRVGSGLMLLGCASWDGTFPADLWVGEMVFTDAHPHGITLAAWRAAYPYGERFPRA